MNKSESIANLAEALSKAQVEMEGAKKDMSNPFFKSKYADLASVWDACREPLGRNGLSVSQIPETKGSQVIVHTILMHSSGEWLRDRLLVPVEPNISKDGKKQAWIQAFGSAVTYARRYALSSMLGVAADEDDDGNATARATTTQARPPQPSASRPMTPAPVSLDGKIRYGKRKGVPFADLSDDDLMKSAAKVITSQDPDDMLMRKDIAVEMERRKGRANGQAGAAVTQ